MPAGPRRALCADCKQALSLTPDCCCPPSSLLSSPGRAGAAQELECITEAGEDEGESKMLLLLLLLALLLLVVFSLHLACHLRTVTGPCAGLRRAGVLPAVDALYRRLAPLEPVLEPYGQAIAHYVRFPHPYLTTTPPHNPIITHVQPLPTTTAHTPMPIPH